MLINAQTGSGHRNGHNGWKGFVVIFARFWEGGVNVTVEKKIVLKESSLMVKIIDIFIYITQL